ncbi:MAG TPA: tetratricopeptide repeat protein [Gemmataceae bacterium]|jgi:tetratricopeptide (TPR) repeat protein
MGRRAWFVIVLLVVVVGVGGWYAWRRYSAPTPPEISREGIDSEVAEAIETARRKIHADPYSVQCWADLGKLLRASQLYPEAVACFAQAERLDPKNPRWPYLQGESLRMSDNNAALPPLQRAAALADSPTSSPNTSADQGGGIAPFLRLAEVHLALGHNDQAEKQLRRALEIEPDDPTVHYYLGLLYLARDDLSASLDHLKRCEHSPITQRKACIQLAAIYRRMGQTQEADNYGRKADTLEQDRNWIDPYLSDVLAASRRTLFDEIQYLEQRGDYRAAVEQLTDLIQKKPEYRYYIALGSDLLELGDLDRAEQTLRSAVALEPEKLAAKYALSRVLWSRADKDEPTDQARARSEFLEAADLARQALAGRPDHAMAYGVLGQSLRRLGKRKEAIDAFRKAIECDPNLSLAHLYLGETLAQDGQIAEARASLERARELSPNDERAKAALEKLNAR